MKKINKAILGIIGGLAVLTHNNAKAAMINTDTLQRYNTTIQTTPTVVQLYKDPITVIDPNLQLIPSATPKPTVTPTPKPTAKTTSKSTAKSTATAAVANITSFFSDLFGRFFGKN